MTVEVAQAATANNSHTRLAVMSAEYPVKRQRGSGDGRTVAVPNLAEANATSSADLESMLKQALGRIDSLERQQEEIKMSMARETTALRADITTLKEGNKALQASTERDTKALKDDINALRNENKALKWSLHRLASKVREGWEYPLMIQPDEYWENKGYDDEAIDNLREGFLANLKRAVSDLELGVCDFISVGRVSHDEDLMPHWNALFRSFKHINPYDTGVELRMQSIELNEEVMRRICHNVRRSNINVVHIENVGFTNLRDAIVELGKALKSTKLKYLDWTENPIESTEDMALFTRVLSQCDTVDEVTFSRNGNENAQALLSGVDLSTYKVLNLSCNNMQTNGRTDISDLIAANTPLEELYLDRNNLNDDDAVLIARSLGRNTHLMRIDVGYNNIQERGKRALYKAVNDISSLNALSDSNHLCCLYGLSYCQINSGCGSNALAINRMFKIQKLMVQRYRKGGGGNVPHLNMEVSGEKSVLLAPFMMESVVRRDNALQEKCIKSYECSLGLLYELVRDWKMVELFSFIGRN